MRRGAILTVAVGLCLIGALSAFQAQFREYPGVEYRLGSIPLPPDWQEKSEWTFARLMYPLAQGMRGGMGAGFGFRMGGSGLWT